MGPWLSPRVGVWVRDHAAGRWEVHGGYSEEHLRVPEGSMVLSDIHDRTDRLPGTRAPSKVLLLRNLEASAW